MKIIVLALCSVIVGCAPTISGLVRVDGSEPLEVTEARINIARVDGAGGEQQFIDVVTIGSDGKFKSKATLEKGQYLVEVLAPGYLLSSKTVTLDASQVIEFDLVPAPEVQRKTIGAAIELDAAKGTGSASLTPPNL